MNKIDPPNYLAVYLWHKQKTTTSPDLPVVSLISQKPHNALTIDQDGKLWVEKTSASVPPSTLSQIDW